MPQPDINTFATTFAQHGVLTLDNLLPQDLANNLHDELCTLDWQLQVKDYSNNSRFELSLSEVPNRNNLTEILYSKKHDIDLNNLFYIRLAVAQENLVSGNLKKVADFLNADNFINTCKAIVGMDDIKRVWLEATCYDKGCFLGNHRDDHNSENRVALILNLTRNWKTDWGGLLMVEANPNSQPMIIPPRWNSLSLMRIPVNHTVTCVSQAAAEHRFSITGWLRP